jgi:hypothetical protein
MSNTYTTYTRSSTTLSPKWYIEDSDITETEETQVTNWKRKLEDDNNGK